LWFANLASLLTKNDGVVTIDESDRLSTDEAIYIEVARIIDLGKTLDLEKTYKADDFSRTC
jgi:hypothetical protein